MDAFNYACTQVRYTIPKEILEKAFINGTEAWRSAGVMNIDEQIRELVIRPRVMTDCNLVGGVQEVLNLSTVDRFSPKIGYFIYRIPMDVTSGRTILVPLSLHYINPEAASYGYTSAYSANTYTGMGGTGVDTSAAMSVASGIVDSLDRIPIVSTARLRLRAQNTVEVHDSVIPPPNVYLRCVLSHNEDMSNLSVRSLPSFANLVTLAVKSYIYNTLIIQIDKGELVYGQELGMFKEIVSGYSDTEQQYQEFLRDEMGAILFMSDQATYSRYIAMMVGGYR